MSRGCDLGERGELIEGMFRSTAVRGDMFCWEVSDLKTIREREDEGDWDLI
jgi:hypothetical protein